MMINLIDADMIHYSVGFSVNDGDIEDAYVKVDSFIKFIEDATGCQDSCLFIGGKGNYRYDILPEYKANRKDKPKPRHHDVIRDYLIDLWGAVVVDGEEVDDRLGYTQTEETIICSADKDLDCIPGFHFNWSQKRLNDGVYKLSELDSDRIFYTQCLVGDSTDNIPGLKKLIGKIATKKKKAPIMDMDNVLDMYNYVNELYEGADWHNTAKCLWIRRKENELWEPPKDGGE